MEVVLPVIADAERERQILRRPEIILKDPGEGLFEERYVSLSALNQVGERPRQPL